MPLRSKIVLKSHLSGETLDAVRDYLRQFLDRRHSLEYSTEHSGFTCMTSTICAWYGSNSRC